MARNRADIFWNTALFGAVFLVSIDRLLKSLALSIWSSQPLPVIKNILTLGFSKNILAAFSLNTFLNPAYIATPILIVLIIWLITAIKKQQRFEITALMFIVLGAGSNLYDRFAYGSVIDYLDLRWFTVFNVADVMICFGIIALLWRMAKPLDKTHY